MSSSESEFECANLSESGSDDDSDVDYSDDDDNAENLDIVRDWCLLSANHPKPAPPRFPFLGTPGCRFILDDETDELSYFQLFFDDLLINMLVTETNRFAQQSQSSSTKQWSPVTVAEIQIFLAIKILQGIIQKPVERMYWTSSEIFETPIFSKLISFGRYCEIKKNLHFSDNENYNAETHPNPRLNKIWPVFDYINKKCSSLYIPERDITIDESLMLYKGRLSWIQYIPLKRARFGIKLYLLCESKSGYLYATIIYTGKGTIINNTKQDMPMSSQVVLSLLQSLLGVGYCLTTDNFYTSPQLADILTKEKTDLYGTMRSNRKEIPVQFQQKKLKKGEIIAYQRGKTMILKWKDKRDICLLSTIHNAEMKETNKRDLQGNVIKKPQVVLDYNDTMGGVDRLDQHLHDYPIARKRGKKYYKKIFFHLLDISVWNSFILYQKNGGRKNNLDFRKTLIEKLITKYHTTKKIGRPSSQPGPLRLTGRHFPEYVPATMNRSDACRRCVVCCSKKNRNGKKIRKETRFYCSNCNVGLCVVPCFMIYHTRLNF